MPGIVAGVGTVRQTVFVAAWCLGATIASVLYYPDPRHAMNGFIIGASALLSATAVYICYRRFTRAGGRAPAAMSTTWSPARATPAR